MKKFLVLPFLAAIALPTSVSAESIWLILRYASLKPSGPGVALEKVEMSNMDQCELMGAKWSGTKRTGMENGGSLTNFMVFGYECIKGK